MSAPDLATLNAPPSADALMTYLINKLASYSVPITDWNPGSVQLTLLEKERLIGVEFLGEMILALAATGWADSARGDFLRQVAYSMYALDWTRGTQARQSVVLARASGYPSVNISGSDLLVASDGAFYRPLSGGTLASPGTLAIVAEALAPGPMTGLVSALKPPIIGVTVQSAAADVSGGSPALGSGDETDVALFARCTARWPDLNAIHSEPIVKTWAKAGSSGAITRIKMAATSSHNEVLLTVAGPSGAISGGALTAAQAYVDPRRPITLIYTLQNCTTLGVSAGGSVWVPRGTLPAVQLAADSAWSTYLTTVDIGTFVSISKFVQIVKDAGAIDVRGEVLGSVPSIPLTQQDLPLGSTDVPIPNAITVGLVNQLLWYEV